MTELGLKLRSKRGEGVEGVPCYVIRSVNARLTLDIVERKKEL